MKLRLALLLAALALALGGAGAAELERVRPERAGMSPVRLARIDAALRDHVERGLMIQLRPQPRDYDTEFRTLAYQAIDD